ncbi:SARP family transcriptional regulator [Streptomyces sp. CB02959]|uniref:AfsR/SARP family transcriptional regulator n=1 Tax=Streptomyces sp. CB02959 TaxID=2020330 RepID=UPI000C271E18|nr:tetratricopeptide repeat protein [Streptomyces sp. CB02959]PJN41428.1 SARP family transcriptional regulator [Streptomyces sp. CB02959]
MEIEIRLSGSVEVRAAGRRRDTGPTKTRLALAALAWDASRTVSMDTLVHRIWDDHPPAKPRDALYVHVARIRKALETDGQAAPAVLTRANSYVMDVDPDRVDLRRYVSLVDQARSLKDNNSAAEALHLLGLADALWCGEPLAGISAYWAGQLRSAVCEKSLAAAMLRAEILLEAGRFGEAVPVLLPFAEDHPADEGLIERIALALHGSGRTADATRLLHRTQRRIVHDLGTDASPRLDRIQQGILASAPVATLLPATTTPVAAPRPVDVPDNLLRDVPWVGRRAEVRRLGAALAEAGSASAPVVTLEAIGGMGGIGKTSLAVHVAHQMRHRFPDGRLYLHLRGHTPDQPPLSVAQALTTLLRLLDPASGPLPQDEAELAALWRGAVRDRRMVVILDDAAGPAQVRPLLPGASPTVVIVTSRRRLTGLPGVRPLSLDVLPRDDAIALFEDRLGAHAAPDRADVAHIVRLCGYVPLAIELMASRLLSRPSWTTADLLRLMNSGPDRLLAIRDHEQRMSTVLELSYRTLPPLERLVFRRIGLHTGSEFGLPAATALTGLPFDVTERAVEELHAYHLVSEPSPHRFRMHDLVREYARSLVADEPPAALDVDTPDDSRLAVRRLTDHYLCVADRADRLVFPFRARVAVAPDGPAPPAATGPHPATAHGAQQWFITEGANLLAALEHVRAHGPADRLASLAHVLAGFMDVEGYLATAEPLLRRAVAHWQAAGHRAARACSLLDLSTVCAHSGQYEEAHRTAREALDLARTLRDPGLEGECLHQLTIPLWHTGQYAAARDLQELSLNLRLQTSDQLQIARSYNLLGISCLYLGETEKSLQCFLQALAGFSSVGDQRGRYRTLNNIAELQMRNGNHKAAENAYREALETHRDLGSRGDFATLQINLASVLTTTGKAPEALDLYETALPTLRSVGDQRGEAIALNGIGKALQAAGRSEEAIPRHVAALATARRIGATGEEAAVLYDLSRAEQRIGCLRQAVVHLEASLAIYRRIGARAEESRTRQALTRLRHRREIPSES